MNSVVLFIANQKELDLVSYKLHGKTMLEYATSQIKRLDVDNFYVVGNRDIDFLGFTSRNSVSEVFDEIKSNDGYCFIVSPFYPLINKEAYEELLANSPSVFIYDNEVVPIYCVKNADLDRIDELAYNGVFFDKEPFRFNSLKDLGTFNIELRNKINNKWLDRGVIILDPSNTTIGEDVTIDKGTTIMSNVTIIGNSVIGKNNLIKEGTKIKDSTIGDNNNIDNSLIDNSNILDNVNIGAYSVIENSDISGDANIGNNVKLNRVYVGNRSNINHLCYIGDTTINEDVRVGAGVITVNEDARSRHRSVVGKNTTIGSNVTIISPINIGEYVLVGAGSVINEDVKDGDMAIARIYQQNKKGYGFKYNQEG